MVEGVAPSIDFEARSYMGGPDRHVHLEECIDE
jgi:hypothetical protein